MTTVHRRAMWWLPTPRARHAPLPPEVVEKTRLHVVDTVAAIVSGAALEAGRAGQAYARSVGGAPQASVLATALRAPAVEAALANGMAAHSQADVRAAGQRIAFLGPDPGQDRFAARVEVMAGAQVLSALQERAVPGRFENPMSKQQVHGKALELMGPVIGSAAARRALRLIERIEELDALGPLIETLRAPA